MLVVISDLHFTDGTSGAHNLPSTAFSSVFLSDVAALAAHKGATELRLLLLGDVVDLVRTAQWFHEAPEDRPWGANGLADIPHPRSGSATERRCLRILGTRPPDGRCSSVPKDTILYQNWETFHFFRHFGDAVRERLGRDLPVEVVYVPGNHDRLVNLYPAVRDALRDVLGLTVTPGTVVGDPEGVWWYPNAFTDRRHGVFARHGHEFDPYNFGGGGDFTRLGHARPAIGDVIATEFAVKLPHRIAEAAQDPAAGLPPDLVSKLYDMDLVRPITSLMEWFYYRIKHEDRGRAREALDGVFDAVILELLALDFTQRWRAPGLLADDAVRLLARPWLRAIPRRLLRQLSAESLLPFFMGKTAPPDPVRGRHVRAAYDEPIWKEDPAVRFVLYGHTHAPLQLPLDGEGPKAAYYVNAGTWRAQIRRTVSYDADYDFVKLKQISYSAFFHAGEDVAGKRPGTVSADFWTGHRIRAEG